MKTRIIFLIFLLTVTFSNAQSKVNLNNCIFSPADKKIAEEILQKFSADNQMPLNELIGKIGLFFLGTPYVAATLENGIEEKLVINLHELDCTTFVESCLALARTVKLKKTDFESFANELEKIRYRDGIRNQYPSRLHYFSEWINNNEAKNIISAKPNKNGVEIVKNISFMSTHPEDYPVLKSNPELIPIIAGQEKNLSACTFYYFPKNNPQNLIKSLKYGDIIALTASIESNVDVNHVGIIIQKDDVFHLLHASLSGKKVILSDGPITDFLLPTSKNSGIMIARPVF